MYKNCRHRLKHRTRPVGGKRQTIPNRVSISERPVEADGKCFGDFEMDTIVGKGNHGAIVTLTERSTNLLLMRK
ncbi:putative transposase [Segatella baroniae B14]|uniref:Putative transposase n=1 Tax=Segatella baroniae B14 TaxID=752555 RepID=D8DZZ7_9BACT|nr:putative transposase [Segatella baroniae B14]